jgi:hypothetical protein
MRRAISSLAFALLAAPLAARAGAPGIPELFYGTAAGRVGSEVDALVAGQVVASTTLAGGTYGRAPALLLLPDPAGDRAGSVVTFAVGGILARESARFTNGALTALDLTLPQDAASSGASSTGSAPPPAESGSSTPPAPDYDLTGDGRVDRRDLALLLGRWGLVGRFTKVDLDGDGVVGLADFNLLIFNFSL